MAISKASRSSRPVKLCTALRAEIEHSIPGGGFSLGDRNDIAMSSFALILHLLLGGGEGGGVVLSPETFSVATPDYWPDSHLHCDIATSQGGSRFG